VLRKYLDLKRDEVKGDWRELHINEMNDLYSAKNNIWVIKTRMRCAEHVTCMGQRAYRAFGRET
jgi:hypothetical protein